MDNVQAFQADVIEALKMVYDPEIPINIYDLGLIYNIDVKNRGNVHITMTLTTPNCPEAQLIPIQVREAVNQYVPGAKEVEVDLVWEPSWHYGRMSEDARLALGL